MDQIGDENQDVNWLEGIAVKEALVNSRKEKADSNLKIFEGKTQMEVADEIGISQASSIQAGKSSLRTYEKICLGGVVK